MKKSIPMILLLIMPYVLIGSFIFQSSLFFNVWKLSYLFVFLPNMIYAFILPRLGYTENQLLFWNMLLKLCNIPIFCLIFPFGLAAMGVFFMAIPILLFLVLFDYSLLLPSTMFGISGLLKAYRAHKISAATLIINIIMQFTFCLDVCSSVYLYISLRKKNKSAVTLQ